MHRLADRYWAIAPDLRGYGDSDKPSGPFAPDNHAADIITLLDKLKIEVVGVVGHGVGGRSYAAALVKPRTGSVACSSLISSTLE